MKLDKKIAVITGAARGIGFAIAKKMAEFGATPIIIDLKTEEIDNALISLQTIKQEATGYVANVTDPDQIKNAFKQIISEFGKIDILINNAGITRDNLIMKMSEAEWDSVIQVNLKGTFNCIQNISRHMLKQRKGSIINISSVIGLIGNVGQANYAASKGGVLALTKAAAKEFASRNIRVNAIAPGFIETEMTKNLPEEIIEKYKGLIPLKRMGKPEDIAQLCVFLASDLADYITGQTINVDGGMIM